MSSSMRRSRSSAACTIILQVFLLSLIPFAAHSASNNNHRLQFVPIRITSSSFRNNNLHDASTISRTCDTISHLRGGSSSSSSSSSSTKTTPSNSNKYRMEQILLLQARSAKLRQALTDRGVLTDYTTLDATATPQPVDWDCAMATKSHPKSCLYSFDAEPNTKVVAPLGTNQWISLAALNRLRRTDPTKVEPMWHNQYAIFASWFRPKSVTSMYAHLPAMGYLLALVLDNPLVLNTAVLAAIVVALALTRPIWETFLTLLLTSEFLWKRWPSWARFVHAALPLKLLLGQMSWKGLTIVFFRIQSIATEYLIQTECRIWEDAIPLTILEGTDAEERNGLEGEEDNDSDVELDY